MSLLLLAPFFKLQLHQQIIRYRSMGCNSWRSDWLCSLNLSCKFSHYPKTIGMRFSLLWAVNTTPTGVAGTSNNLLSPGIKPHFPPTFRGVTFLNTTFWNQSGKSFPVSRALYHSVSELLQGDHSSRRKIGAAAAATTPAKPSGAGCSPLSQAKGVRGPTSNTPAAHSCCCHAKTSAHQCYWYPASSTSEMTDPVALAGRVMC